MYLPGQEPLPTGMTEDDRKELQEVAKYQRYTMQAMESCVAKAAISGVIGFGLGAFISLMSASFAIDDPLRQTMLDKAAAERARAETEAKGKGGNVASTQGAKAVATASTTKPATTAPTLTGAEGKQGLSFSGRLISKLPGGSKYIQNLPAPPPMLPENSMQSTKAYFVQTGKNMYSSGRGFGKVGALYSGIECCIESFRARNDMANPVLAGLISGGILARNAGPQAIIGGALAFGGFSAVIDLLYVPLHTLLMPACVARRQTKTRKKHHDHI